ncbi:MAG: tRNA 5-methoxyuridine(34)/uridine 5-oxyacetic acid(34) synthase CmoB [Wenzhouxiangella sp.]|nr:MAG: tRNA 5-methoxyuridine(34)/uridine 5-oxyacetic acid(34) synthase CmoB [Wenzhouxiangella sp.]
MPAPVVPDQAVLQSALTRNFGADHSRPVVAVHEQNLTRHGDFARWSTALASLPSDSGGWFVEDGRLHAGTRRSEAAALTRLLRELIPWRKGPLCLAGVAIDTEWRSDWKWRRIAPHIDLSGARVLDVGAGNGYFGWRMLQAGADFVLGCDPTQLFVMQHAMIRRLAGAAENYLLAMRLEEMPAALSDFDAVFSMGVLYHRRDPAGHLAELGRRLRPRGLLVLETLVLPGDREEVMVPPGRYAGMGNVHALPTVASLLAWLQQAGFRDPRCLDVSVTTSQEQRTTEWMPFHSLADALDRDRPDLTIEGLPRPRRAALIARR